METWQGWLAAGPPVRRQREGFWAKGTAWMEDRGERSEVGAKGRLGIGCLQLCTSRSEASSAPELPGLALGASSGRQGSCILAGRYYQRLSV